MDMDRSMRLPPRPRERGIGTWGPRLGGAAIVAVVLLEAASPAITGQAGVSETAFVEVTREAGVDFVHVNGATPEKYMPETMGGGAIIFDYDDDGWADLFFVDGGSFVDPVLADAARHRLYRNNGDWTFTDVSANAGIARSGYGMGACAADYDGDGLPDLYVTSVGENRLYRNQGGGRFLDVTASAGVGDRLWSSSCAFADVDNDGDVDLYVVNYVDFSVDNNKDCTYSGVRGYCHPNVYNGQSDRLYRNNGDGTFADVSLEAGVSLPQGKGLGVVFSDYDADGWIDIYVANDSVRNFLFHNRGDGTFEEVGLVLGVALGSSGEPLAGMGTDMGDVDGDGLAEIVVTNLDRQTHNLYRNTAPGLFDDMTFESGLAEATLPFVGFGVAFLDYDNDGDLDLAIANGDVLDNVGEFREGASYHQRNLLLRNDGRGLFEEVGSLAGPGFALSQVSRALATGDLDNDGDLDILIANNGQAPALLRNDTPYGNALILDLVGAAQNTDGVGARLRLVSGARTLYRTVKAGSSYLAQSDLRVHFGLGAEAPGELQVEWPGGRVDVFRDLPANRIVTIREGVGLAGEVPLSRP
jgi:hypothetical protein